MYTIYETKKIEHYEGFHSLENYILGCVLSSQSEKENKLFHTGRELHTFLTLALTKLYSLDYKWDKYVCLEEMYIIGMPILGSNKNHLTLFSNIKDSKHSFIVTNINLSKIIPDIRELSILNVQGNELFKILSSTYEFVDKLFNISLSSVKTVEFDENQNMTTKPVALGIVSNKEKFDKSNYIQL